jgi:hypothetical protein
MEIDLYRCVYIDEESIIVYRGNRWGVGSVGGIIMGGENVRMKKKVKMREQMEDFCLLENKGQTVYKLIKTGIYHSFWNCNP